MKRKPRRTRRQLALALAGEPSTQWPTPTRVALLTALADLLIEAHHEEQESPVEERRHDEPEDHH
ncbi:MAG TPA: hypothetical protein VLW55_00240 [Burkholderiaceae bacterium]|nr:hypothetical protein [Burkholderiaceae bacterium]